MTGEIVSHFPTDSAITIDFREIPDEGTAFEELVGDLLTDLDYAVDPTGVGSDLGIDLSANYLIADPIGGQKNLKYVVECKHFAHSGRSVGVRDIANVAIIDRVASTNADGFLLASSTPLSSRLTDHLADLRRSHPQLTIRHWGPPTLREFLLQAPNLLARYFPKSLISNTQYLKKPRTKIGSTCYERVQAHQSEFVGIKFIPHLYVAREVERDLFDCLANSRELTASVGRAIAKTLTEHSAQLSHLTTVPTRLEIPSDPKRHFTWSVNVEEIVTRHSHTLEEIRGFNCDLWEEYVAGGPDGVRRAVAAIQKTVKDVQNRLDDSISPFESAAESLRRAGRRPSRKKKEAASDRNHTIPNKKAEVCLQPKSKSTTGRLRGADDSCSVDDFLEQISRFRKICRRNVLADLQGVLRKIEQSTQMVVDVAGSGKTNLCCRLSLELTSRTSVLFLTGRALGKRFATIENEAEDLLTDLQPKISGTLKERCQAAAREGHEFCVVLDGVNEAEDFSRMRRELLWLVKFAKTAPLRILVTSRVEYWQDFSAIVGQTDYVAVSNQRMSQFTEKEHDIAVRAYLNHYRIKVRLEQRAWDQLTRPLLLRFFCEAYGDPARKRARELLPVREIQLFRLFEEYCATKFSNISQAVERTGVQASEKDVEAALLKLAEYFLRNRKTSVDAAGARRVLRRQSSRWREIYRAILDEDILLEETPDIYNRRVRRAGFVYESFMEYLMAHVLLGRPPRDDKSLASRVRQLYSERDSFPNVKGVGTFLLPLCFRSHRRTFEAVRAQLEDPDMVDSSLPALINLMECDWKTAIWPVLRTVSRNVLSLPTSRVQAFVSDWLADHDPEPFLECLEKEPRVMTALFGAGVWGLLLSDSCRNASPDRVFAAARAILVGAKSMKILEEFLMCLRMGSRPRGSLSITQDSFCDLVESSLPCLEENVVVGRGLRRWDSLVLLGAMGKTLSADASGISDDVRGRLGSVVEECVRDQLLLRDNLAPEIKWWVERLSVDLRAIRKHLSE